MKKIFLLSSLVLLTYTQAQQKKVEKNEKFKFGIKAGGNVSKITGGEDMHRTHHEKIGYYGGVTAKYAITRKMGVQTDVLFNNLGSSTVEKDNNAKGKIQMNYISVPVLGQYQIIPKLYAETGPEFSFNLTSKIEEKNPESVTYWEKFTKIFHFGWSLGAGYHITDNLVGNFRGNIGLISPFIDNPNRAEVFRINNIQLGMTYLF